MNARTLLLAAALAGIGASASAADPINILFVGNSHTFGHVDPETWMLLAGGLVLFGSWRKGARSRL